MAELDKIYEAYSGMMGKAFQEKTKERIQWILSNVQKKDMVLDIGCSQGIIALLAAEKGANVLGIDVESVSVEFAKNLVQEKFSHVNNRIEFKVADFLNFESTQKYDVVIATEVIEHLHKPEIFLNKIKKHLQSNGKIILTVPFGINDHPDHHTTFFLTNFISLVDQELAIEDIVFMGNWIGAICTNRKKDEFIISKELLVRYDRNLHKINEEQLQNIKNMQMNFKNINQKYKQAVENYETAKQWVTDKNKKIETMTQENQELKNVYKKVNEELNVLRCEYKNNLLSVWNDYARIIEILEDTNRKIQHLEVQNGYLKSENEQYRRKLSIITESAWGKFGIKIYKKLKSVKSKFAAK